MGIQPKHPHNLGYNNRFNAAMLRSSAYHIHGMLVMSVMMLLIYNITLFHALLCGGDISE